MPRQPGLRISGSKWQRELAALRLLYEWAEKMGHIARGPVLVHAVRPRDGSMVMAADQALRDVRCSYVKCCDAVNPRARRGTHSAQAQLMPARGVGQPG